MKEIRNRHAMRSWGLFVLAPAAMLLLLSAGCAQDDGDGLSMGEAALGWEEPPYDGGELTCPRGPVGEIRVDFDCECVFVESCKDISNVVLELADGSHVKLDELDGHTGTFCGDQALAGVWVKAGNNQSGDGPGYGERFDAPEQTCPPDEYEPCESDY